MAQVAKAESEQKEEPKEAKIKQGSGAISLFSVARKRRKKKQVLEDQQKKKKNPGLMRVQVDLGELELPHNAKITMPDPNNIENFKITIDPDQGFWNGASYVFDFKIPADYPIKPPKVTCDTKIYHPNIDLQGNVCLNLLKADWRPILSVQQVVHGLIFLFLEPNPADPLNLEAAKVFRENINAFEQNVNKSLAGGYVGGAQFPRQNLKK